MSKSNNKSAHLPRCRCTEEERAAIDNKAREAGLSLSEYQRRACLNAVIVIRESAADVNAVRQLSAIGNNLNQLTRRAHIHDDIERGKLRGLLAKIDEIITGFIS